PIRRFSLLALVSRAHTSWRRRNTHELEIGGLVRLTSHRSGLASGFGCGLPGPPFNQRETVYPCGRDWGVGRRWSGDPDCGAIRVAAALEFARRAHLASSFRH